MNFDINDLASTAQLTYDVQVGQRDDGSPVGFKVLGQASEEYDRAEREVQVLNVREATERRSPADIDSEEGAERWAAGVAARRQIVIKHCVVGWYGFTIGQDQPAEFNAENLARVLGARKDWVRRLANAIETEANFTKG